MFEKGSHNDWSNLFKTGGSAATAIIALAIIQILVFSLWGLVPTTATEYFVLFQRNPFLGLLHLDLLLAVDYVLLIPLFLSLYVALRQSNESIMLISTAFALIGIAIYFSSNTSFSMIYLSQQYSASTTEVQKAVFLAAGESMLATFQGTSFHTSYILTAFASLMISAVMLKSRIFNKATGLIGILANAIGLDLYVPLVGLFSSLVSVVVLQVWLILVAKRLFHLSREENLSL